MATHRPRCRPSYSLRTATILAAAGLLAAPTNAQDAIWGESIPGYDGRGYDVVPVLDGSGDFFACGDLYSLSMHVFGLGTEHEIAIPLGDGYHFEAYTARYRSDGTPVWARMGRGGQRDRATALASFPDGSLVVGGAMDGWVNGRPPTGITLDGGSNPDIALPPQSEFTPFFARYSGEGDLLWARHVLSFNYASGGSIDDFAPLPDGGFFAAGNFRGGQFGDANDPNPITIVPGGSIGIFSSEGFLARYAPNGDVLWVQSIGGSAADTVTSVDLLPDGDVILAGTIGRRDITTATFFPGHPAEVTLAPTGAEGYFVLRLDFDVGAETTTPNFAVQWLHTYGDDNTGTQRMVVSPQGDVYLAGASALHPTEAGTKTWDGEPVASTVFGEYAGHVVRLDPDTGDLLWVAGTTGGVKAIDIVGTSDGVVALVNTSGSSNIFDGQDMVQATTFLHPHVKWNRDGDVVWGRSNAAQPFGVTQIADGGAVATGKSWRGAFLDFKGPTQIALGPTAYLGKYDAAPAMSLNVPDDLARQCDPGAPHATVHFVVDVNGAPAGSALEVVDGSGALLAWVDDPDGAVGIGPLEFPVGATEVIARLLDATGAVLLEDSFVVAVEDTAPPAIDGCDAATVECMGAETPVLRSLLGITVSDDCDPDPELVFVPSTVGMGTTLVTARATDDTGNVTQCAFELTVVDTLPPVFSVVPADITRECTSSAGALVTFELEAHDACGVASLTCVDQNGTVVDGAGTTFPVGVHTVTCTATDPSGNSDSVAFQVTVEDNTAPTLVAPSDMTLPNDPGLCAAAATFEVVATDDCDPDVPVVCTAPWGEVVSGDLFPVGTTTVVCTAADHAGNEAEVSFAITVFDGEPPTLGGSAGGAVSLVTDCAGTSLSLDLHTLGLTLTDNCDANPRIELSPTTVDPGYTLVAATVTDAAGNEATTLIDVDVLRGPLDCEILRPLDPDVDNRVHAGSVVPIRLRLTCENVEDVDATVTIDQIDLLDSEGTPVANETIEDPGLSQDDGAEFRLTGDQFHYNLSTAGWDPTKGARHRVTIRIAKAGHVDSLCHVYLVNK